MPVSIPIPFEQANDPMTELSADLTGLEVTDRPRDAAAFREGGHSAFTNGKAECCKTMIFHSRVLSTWAHKCYTPPPTAVAKPPGTYFATFYCFFLRATKSILFLILLMKKKAATKGSMTLATP